MRNVPRRLLHTGVAVAAAGALAMSVHSPISAHQSHAVATLRANYLENEAKWTHTMDPAFVSDQTSYDILFMNQANLVKQLPSGTVVPYLAERWTVSKNRKVYTFTLRPNLRFSNGDPVTAQDVAFSVTRSLLKATGSPLGTTYTSHIIGAKDVNDGKTNKLAGVKVLNPRQIRFTLDKPVAFFLAALTYPTNDVLDPRVINGKKPNSYMTTTCKANVGAGPFRVVCRNGSTNLSSFYPSGSTPTITMEPNPYFFGKKPSIRITMPVMATDIVNYRTYKAGGTDMTVIPSADIKKEQKSPGFMHFRTSAVYYLTPDSTNPPFNNEHCRLAVAYALDRDTINNKVLHGIQSSIYDVVPKGMLGYYSGKDNPHYNPSKARSELAQCTGGIHTTFEYPTGSSDNDNQAAAMYAMFSAVGIDLKQKGIPLNDWYNLVGSPLAGSHVNIAYNGWIEDYNDPQDYVTLLNRAGEGYDIGGYDNAAFNKLVDQADVTADPNKRAQLYVKAQHMLLAGGNWITIGQQIQYVLIRSNVHGFVGSFQGPWPRNSDWSNVTIH